MTSSRQSSTWVPSAGCFCSSGTLTQPISGTTHPAATTVAMTILDSIDFMVPSRIRARVEPPLGADTEEVLGLALREDVFDGVERARAAVAEARDVQEAE